VAVVLAQLAVWVALAAAVTVVKVVPLARLVLLLQAMVMAAVAAHKFQAQ
jgi:hypothetical protein